MPNVITFTPRPRPVVPPPALPPADLDLRIHLKEATHTAFDAADKIIAALDQMDHGSVIKSRIVPLDLTVEGIRPSELVTNPTEKAAETRKSGPEITSTPMSEPTFLPEAIECAPPLRWYGGGNMISATGVALFGLIAGA